MASIRARIERLSELLETAQDLYQVADYFHDQLGNEPDLHESSEAAEHEELRVALQMAGRRALNSEQDLDPLMILRWEDRDFYHGVGHLGSKFVVFLYFEKHRKGLMIIVAEETHFVRFTTFDISAQGTPAPPAEGLN